MEATTLPAGRLLDALIAARIFGWRHIADGFGRGPGTNAISLLHDEVPHYSTDLAAAWLVVDQLRKQEYGFTLTDHMGRDAWIAGFVTWGSGKPDGEGEADTVPLAICRAALATLAE